jgi:cyclic beta-1,2-glucan synthetase
MDAIVLLTNAGSGYSTWQERDLTRWRADTTLDDWGTWIYVQDVESGALWSAGSQPVPSVPAQREVYFYPHQVDFRCNLHGIVTHLSVTVPPEDDVEIRRLQVTNQGGQPRRLRVTSYGEVVLSTQDSDRRHPAFNKLFIVGEYHQQINGLLFTRRARSPKRCLSIYARVGGATGPASQGCRAYTTGRR